ncbi:unnamed protein product, partial [marine sediment metagenome]
MSNLADILSLQKRTEKREYLFPNRTGPRIDE